MFFFFFFFQRGAHDVFVCVLYTLGSRKDFSSMDLYLLLPQASNLFVLLTPVEPSEAKRPLRNTLNSFLKHIGLTENDYTGRIKINLKTNL